MVVVVVVEILVLCIRSSMATDTSLDASADGLIRMPVTQSRCQSSSLDPNLHVSMVNGHGHGQWSVSTKHRHSMTGQNPLISLTPHSSQSKVKKKDKNVDNHDDYVGT